jgi:hypothetical protein
MKKQIHFLSGLEASATSVCTKTVDCRMQRPYWTSRLVIGRGIRELEAAEEATGEVGASLSHVAIAFALAVSLSTKHSGKYSYQLLSINEYCVSPTQSI